MFTGIIEDLGKVRKTGRSTLAVETVLDDIKTGDSIAVNGICLTVTRIEARGRASILSFDFSPETSGRTSLQGLESGNAVNLERAMRPGDRLGGHFLSGHIEGTGKLLSVSPRGDFVLIAFSADKPVSRYLVPKGSVGVDGISLTVADVTPGSFTVSVIPHTVKNTNLHLKKTGDTVNLEPDMLAKYAENALQKEKRTGITYSLLKENGFA